MTLQRPSRRPVEESVVDLLHADVPDDLVADADESGPELLGPSRPELLRFAWASAVLDRHPELLRPWALSVDRAVRRAVMRSPQLDADVAERVLATRRSGIHTLGSNPATPRRLLRDNPSALRRRDRLDAIEPAGIVGVDRTPNRPALVDEGSGTVDLVMARAELLDPAHAALIAARRSPAVDPWVGALLVARFGGAARDPLLRHAARGRIDAMDRLEGAAAGALTRPTDLGPHR